MQIETISQFTLGDTSVGYLLESKSGNVGVWLVPSELATEVQRFPDFAIAGAALDVAEEHGQPLWRVDPLVHLQRIGDAYPPYFSQGRTLRNGPSTRALTYAGQHVEADGDTTTILTELRAADGVACEHRLIHRAGDAFLRCETTFRNDSSAPVGLEMLSSFSLGGLTPFANDASTGRLRIHRCRSSWAAEGQLVTQSPEDLHLEPSFSRFSAVCERFGQVGTMPTRGFFPFVAVEDTAAGVLWGAQLAWAGSWQMELYRKDDPLCISGGLADREFGHWTKTIAPGESFTAPSATLACVHGDLETLCDRLTSAQQTAADTQPDIEADLPIVFNEWCSTWGHPTHASLTAIAERLRGSAVKYLVIDAGWYTTENGRGGHGDWLVNGDRFPDGLKATADAIRNAGLIPGLWFEFENCTRNAAAFERPDWLLRRDGHPITVANRRFLDLNHPGVAAFLQERVIELLRACGIGYLKVDYNETIGIGCDGAESLGEGLRRQVEAGQRFFRRLRSELSDLVIENCASGGHRLEPSMLALSAMSSFSDAHECPEIPLIAADLHRVMLPRQSQIWAVLRKDDTEQRLVYSLVATFLGRMCLSGDIAHLGDEQWHLCQQAEALYGKAAPIIKRGFSRRYGSGPQSYRRPTGWQAVVRTSANNRRALAVIHAFAGGGQAIRIDLPEGRWTAIDHFSVAGRDIRVDDNALTCDLHEWDAAVVLLECK